MMRSLFGSKDSLQQQQGSTKGPVSLPPVDLAPSLDKIPVSLAELKASWFLLFCTLLHFITVASAVGSALFHCHLLIYPCNGVEMRETREWNEMPGTFIRIYCIVFCLLITMVEREEFLIFKIHSLVAWMDSWVLRGLFLVFNGLMMEVVREQPCEFCSMDAFSRMCGMWLGGIGALYTILGLLCFRQLRQRQLTQIRRKKQMLLQAQHLSQHKSEIEKLLRETETKMQSFV